MLTDLAAGLGMVGAGMLVFDAQACELELQQHLAPARASGEDGGVVAEQGGRQVELLGGRMEAVDDIAGADVRIITEDGELIRALTLDPNRNYQPLGGRWPVHNVLQQVSTMS